MSNILQAIYNTVDEINRQLLDNQQLAKSTDTIIVGDGGQLDSLGVINFLVLLEEKLSQEAGISIALLDEDTIGEVDGPLRTIGRIEQFITGQL